MIIDTGRGFESARRQVQGCARAALRGAPRRQDAQAASEAGKEMSVAIREIVFDTETTGLNPLGGDRIVEIGCVEMFNHVPTGRTLPRLPQSRARHA